MIEGRGSRPSGWSKWLETRSKPHCVPLSPLKPEAPPLWVIRPCVPHSTLPCRGAYPPMWVISPHVGHTPPPHAHTPGPDGLKLTWSRDYRVPVLWLEKKDRFSTLHPGNCTQRKQLPSHTHTNTHTHTYTHLPSVYCSVFDEWRVS